MRVRWPRPTLRSARADVCEKDEEMREVRPTGTQRRERQSPPVRWLRWTARRSSVGSRCCRAFAEMRPGCASHGRVASSAPLRRLYHAWYAPICSNVRVRHGGNSPVFMPICPALCLFCFVRRRFFFRPHGRKKKPGLSWPPNQGFGARSGFGAEEEKTGFCAVFFSLPVWFVGVLMNEISRKPARTVTELASARQHQENPADHHGARGGG